MRKIEEALKWHIGHYKKDFKQGNTVAWYVPQSETGNPYGDRFEIHLHNNHIATYWPRTDELEINTRTLAEWPTPTTKSRLRALGANVTTKKGKTYLDGVEVER